MAPLRSLHTLDSFQTCCRALLRSATVFEKFTIKSSSIASQRSVLIPHHIHWASSYTLRHGCMVLARSCQRSRTGMCHGKVSQTNINLLESYLTKQSTTRLRQDAWDCKACHPLLGNISDGNWNYDEPYSRAWDVLRGECIISNGIHCTV